MESFYKFRCKNDHNFGHKSQRTCVIVLKHETLDFEIMGIGLKSHSDQTKGIFIYLGNFGQMEIHFFREKKNGLSGI